MQQVMNFKMYEILKNQFRSNLFQDILALSGLCSEDELSDIVEKAVEMVHKKIEEDGKEVSKS